MERNEVIDFVIPWVNGDDPEWLNLKKAYPADSQGIIRSDSSDERYCNWDNLQYWFRGVEKYAPWVNKIHFITWGHLPEWLNESHPKLNIVRHEDFIPPVYMPTFNANTIELNMHRIKGLSEHFVYFNDDMFILKKIDEKDFFRNGKPCDMLAFQPVVANPSNPVMSRIFMNNSLLLSRHFDKRSNVRSQPGSYFKPGYPPLYFVYNLMELFFPLFTGFYNSHGPSAFCKKTFETLWEKEPEVLDSTCRHKFRGDDVNQYLVRDWQKLSKNFCPVNVNRMLRYFDVSDNNEKLIKTIKMQSSKIICINDSNKKTDFDDMKDRINQTFALIFPEKSSFEK